MLDNFQEISFDVFLQVIWEDKRVHHKNNYSIDQKYIELKIDDRHQLWVNVIFPCDNSVHSKLAMK